MWFWVGVIFLVIAGWFLFGRRWSGCTRYAYIVLAILSILVAIYFIGSYYAYRPVRDDQVMSQLRTMAAPHPLTYQELVRVEMSDNRKVYEFPGGTPSNLVRMRAVCENKDRPFADPLCKRITP